MKKKSGDSPLKVIMVALLVIFFIGVFVFQINKYLLVSHDTKVQGQLNKMALMIETDSMDQDSRSKYAYIHSPNDYAVPLKDERKKYPFKATKTLAQLFIERKFSVAKPSKDTCYIFSYWPQKLMRIHADFRDKKNPGYLIAAWNKRKKEAVIVGTPDLQNWGEKHLKAEHFQCNPVEINPAEKAVSKNSESINIPGYDFQFSTLNFSSPFFNTTGVDREMLYDLSY